MITGFNTDIEHAGVVYHVQTEDKGLDSPLILSLVYTGGAILASKRTPYQDLIAAGFDEEVLTERLKRQHRLICAAINAGRIEELKRMSGREVQPVDASPALANATVELESEEAPQSVASETTAAVTEDVFEFDIPEPITVPVESAEVPPIELVDGFEFQAPEPVSVPAEPVDATAATEVSDDTVEVVVAPQRRKPRRKAPPPKLPTPEPVGSEDDTLEINAPAAAEAPYTAHDSRGQVEPDATAVGSPSLVLSLLDDDEFISGESFLIRVMVQDQSGANEKPLAGVAVSVKILGTTFRPQMYSVKSQRDGVAVVSTEIPWFSSGRAAVLIRADHKGFSTELRRVIYPAGGVS